jgi:mRNA deadenylase 3'-5' endonuclease subunit Ccr4
MKIVSLNIECDKHYERIFPFLENESVDVVCMQEVLEEDFEYIKENLGMGGVYIPQGIVTSSHPSYSHLYGKLFGVAIFSSTILESGYSFYWGNENNCRLDVSQYSKDVQGLQSFVTLWVKVIVDGVEYRCVTTHFPVTVEGQSSPYQVEVANSFLKGLEQFENFFFCGDFNAPRGNETFAMMARKYKDCIPEKYVTSLDQNLHRFPGIQFMVDGLFTTVNYIASDVTLVDGLSDHMAIVATIIKV